MGSELGELGFAGALAQSRAMQSIVRVLNLYSGKYPGPCTMSFVKNGEEGVEINFGSSDIDGAQSGLADMLRFVELTDELLLLEAMISNLRDRRADEGLIGALVDEAKEIVAILYPHLVVADIPHA